MNASATPHVFLGRQPILGRDQQLLAYELLFRDGECSSPRAAETPDGTQATSTVIANAFAELATSDSPNPLGPYPAYLKVSPAFFTSDLIEALPPPLVVLEIPATLPATADNLDRCQQLRHKGFRLALDDVTEITAEIQALAACVDILKIDIAALDAEPLRQLASKAKAFGKQLLAEKVDTAEQFARCQQLGFDAFQGYFFAQPTIISGRKLNPSQVALLRILTLVMQDAETPEIENAFKQEPGLTVNMLRLTNSVSSGLTTRITSLRHAITILGRRQIQRWLQLLIYTSPKSEGQPLDDPLLLLAATRGRLMELLAERIQPRNREFADQAFMAGIMSLMPTLLGIPMPNILTQLPVSPKVGAALTDRTGQHGMLLLLVEATEQTDEKIVREALGRLPAMPPNALEASLTQALAWANHLDQEKR